MKLAKHWIALGALLGLGSLGIAYEAGRARAVGVPAAKPLTYSGVLTDTNGVPVQGSKNIQLQIFDAATAGTSLCSVGPTAITLQAGAFEVPIDDTCLPALRGTPDLWVEIFVDGASMKRSKIGAVPFALEAARATTAGGPLDARIAALEAALPRDATGGLHVCSGSTPPGNTAWMVYGDTPPTQIFVNVDTSACGFKNRPIYLTSIGGTTSHWTTTGGSEPYEVKDFTYQKGFRIYLNNGSGGVSPATANTNGWYVQWIGIGN